MTFYRVKISNRYNFVIIMSPVRMKNFLGNLILILLLSGNAYANDIRYFKIEDMRIGDSALDYFSETELENSEQDWWNYSHKEYSTSLLPGKGIYDWFKISYKSDDDNFIIEGVVGIVEKKNYNNKECNKQLDSAVLDISKVYKNIKPNKKKKYNVTYDLSKTFYTEDKLGKSKAISVSFNLLDEIEIILACYDIDKESNEVKSYIIDINQFDSFRIAIKSRAFTNFLKKQYEKKI